MHQCPYDKACKCSMEDPCKGCETWAENNGVMWIQSFLDEHSLKLDKMAENQNEIHEQYNIMRDALIKICHLYKINTIYNAPLIARDALDKIKIQITNGELTWNYH